MKQQFIPFIGECLKAVFDHAESGLDLVLIQKSMSLKYEPASEPLHISSAHE